MSCDCDGGHGQARNGPLLPSSATSPQSSYLSIASSPRQTTCFPTHSHLTKSPVMSTEYLPRSSKRSPCPRTGRARRLAHLASGLSHRDPYHPDAWKDSSAGWHPARIVPTETIPWWDATWHQLWSHPYAANIQKAPGRRPTKPRQPVCQNRSSQSGRRRHPQ